MASARAQIFSPASLCGTVERGWRGKKFVGRKAKKKKGSHAKLCQRSSQRAHARRGMPRRRPPPWPSTMKSAAKRRAAKRWREKNRQRIREYNRGYWKAHAERINASRRKRLTASALHEAMQAELSVVTARALRDAQLTYIDERGRVWREDNRTAEEVIAAWQQKQKQKQKQKQEPAGAA